MDHQLLVSVLVIAAFVALVVMTNPEGRNPHVNARRSRQWWKRPPS